MSMLLIDIDPMHCILLHMMIVELFVPLQEVALERLVAALVEEKGGVPNDFDDGNMVLEGAELNQTCVLVGRSGDKKHPERLV